MANSLKGLKYDGGKPPLSMIPRAALEEEAKVMAYGAGKYGKDNFRSGMVYSRLLDAALRHIYAFTDGQNSDEETGLSHLAHARCCLGFLLEYINKGIGKDDRYNPKENDAPVRLGYPVQFNIAGPAGTVPSVKTNPLAEQYVDGDIGQEQNKSRQGSNRPDFDGTLHAATINLLKFYDNIPSPIEQGNYCDGYLEQTDPVNYGAIQSSKLLRSRIG